RSRQLDRRSARAVASADGAVEFWDTATVVWSDRTGPLLWPEDQPGTDPPSSPRSACVEPDVVTANAARRPGAGYHRGPAAVGTRTRTDLDHRTAVVEVADRHGRAVRRPPGADLPRQRRIDRTVGIAQAYQVTFADE